MSDTAFNRVTTQGNPAHAEPETFPPTADILSDPTVDVLGDSAVLLLPRGAAWGSPDGEALSVASTLYRFCRALAAPMAALYRRAFELTDESRAVSTIELLADWERDYDLPDACSSEDETTAARLRALLLKVRSAGTITPADFVDLAFELGYRVEIEEHFIFECGHSECGGQHQTGPLADEYYWTVRVAGIDVDYFRAGESECGFDPLFQQLNADSLICKFREVAPGWTLPVFDFIGTTELMLDGHAAGVAMDFRSGTVFVKFDG